MDRLILAVDQFAEQHPSFEVTAQIKKYGQTLPHLCSHSWLNPKDFKQAFLDCSVFVSHAGMGNILLAAQHNKQIIVMPRQAQYGEHINDHQLATVEGLKDRSFVHVVNTAEELQSAILRVVSMTQSPKVNKPIENWRKKWPQRAELVDALSGFLNQE